MNNVLNEIFVDFVEPNSLVGFININGNGRLVEKMFKEQQITHFQSKSHFLQDFRL